MATNITISSSSWSHFLSAIHWAAVIKAGLLLITAHFLARYACLAFKKISHVYLGLESHQIYLGERTIFYIIWVIFVLMAAQHLGFSLNILLGATGILTIAVGFASQTSIANLISGIFLILEKPFKVGDLITVGDITGEVLTIDALSAKLKTPDSTYVRIPNEILIKSNIINLSHYPMRRLDIYFEIKPEAVTPQFITDLMSFLMEDIRCLAEPKPFIQVENFSTGNLKVHIGVYTSNNLLGVLKNDLHWQIFQHLKKNQVELAIPSQKISINSKSFQ